MKISEVKKQFLHLNVNEYPGITSSLIRLFFIGACTSLGIQLLSVWPELPELILYNRINESVRLRIVFSTIAGGLLAYLIVAIWMQVFSRHNKLSQLETISKLYYPLIVVPIIVILLNPLIFRDQQLLALITILLLSLMLEYTLRISQIEASALQSRWLLKLKRHTKLLPDYLPSLVLTLLVTGFIIYFTHYTLLNHYRFQTFSFDLGLYDNMMWNTLHGKWFMATPLGPNEESHFTYHAEFGAYFIAPFYAIRPQADTLLIIQAILAGSTLIPIYLIAKLRLQKPWLALSICYVLTMYAPLHGPLFYDFHFLTVSIFFIAWSIYFYEKGNLSAMLISSAMAILWREDVGLGLSAVGIYYLLSGKKPLWAINLIVLPVLYFISMKILIMPLYGTHLDIAQSHIWAYMGLIPEGKNSLPSIFSTLISNPVYALRYLLDQNKLIYILQLFIPLLFLPLRSPRIWVILLPAAAFTLLATEYVPVYSISYQYTAYWIAYLFFALILCLHEWQQNQNKKHQLQVIVPVMIVISTITSLHFGAIFQQKTFSMGMADVSFDYTDTDSMQYSAFVSLARQIPDDASVAATETEVPHLSNRENCYTLRLGYSNAEYILARNDTINQDKKSNQVLFNALNSGQYRLISSNQLFSLWGKTSLTRTSGEIKEGTLP